MRTVSEQLPENTDGQNPAESRGDYSSQIDPNFSRAWNETFTEEDPAKAEQDAAKGTPAGEAEATPAPPVEPAGQQPGETAPTAGGEAAPAATPPAKPGDVPTATEAGAGSPASGTPAPAGAIGTRSHAEYATALDAASGKLVENSQAAFREAAWQEIQSTIDPTILQMVNEYPRRMIGETVPSLKGEGTEVLKDSRDAEDWQNGVKHVIENQVNSQAATLQEESRPLLSTLQDSITMLRSNKDMVPGTKEYNPELAKQVLKMASSYLYKVDGKAIGFRVDIQPLIDSVREQLKSQAPATATARQEQAAGQTRAADGTFEAPQAGIPSRTGMSGTESEDYTAFWSAVGQPGMQI